jgi:hypothetical protein
MFGSLGILSGAVMTDLRHHFRLPWIVLAAILGLFSIVGEASASTPTATPRNSARACCIGRVCSACCCVPADAVSSPAAVKKSVVIPARPTLTSPVPLCECRPGGPTSPASKTEPCSFEDHSSQASATPPEMTVEHRPAITLVWIIPSTGNPPKSPLYLRTSRLLI